MPIQFGYSVFQKLEFSRGFLYVSNIAVRISEAAMGSGLESIPGLLKMFKNRLWSQRDIKIPMHL